MEGEPRFSTLTYVLPTAAVSGYGDWLCSRSYWGDFKSALTCGCPECLGDAGLTLCWSAPDVDDGLREQDRTHRIVPLVRLFDRMMAETYVLPAYRYRALRYLGEREHLLEHDRASHGRKRGPREAPPGGAAQDTERK